MSFDAESAGTVKELGQVHVSSVDDVLELLRPGGGRNPRSKRGDNRRDLRPSI